MLYFALLAFVAGLGLPIAAAGAAIGQGIATKSALEGISRQPESAPRIQLTMLIGLALIESLVIYVLLTFFILQAKLPDSDLMLEAIKGSLSSGSVSGPAKLSIDPAPFVPTDQGKLTAKVTIRVWDKNSNPLKGEEIRALASKGAMEKITDNGDGTYTALWSIDRSEATGNLALRVSAANGVFDDITLTPPGLN